MAWSTNRFHCYESWVWTPLFRTFQRWSSQNWHKFLRSCNIGDRFVHSKAQVMNLHVIQPSRRWRLGVMKRFKMMVYDNLPLFSQRRGCLTEKTEKKSLLKKTNKKFGGESPNGFVGTQTVFPFTFHARRAKHLEGSPTFLLFDHIDVLWVKKRLPIMMVRVNQ